MRTKKTVKEVTEKAVNKSAMESLASISTKLGAEIPIGGSFKIMGRVSKHRVVSGVHGEQIQFKGDFGALVDGRRYTAKKAYLPYEASELLEQAMSQRTDTKPLEFAIELVKTPSDKAERGYSWQYIAILMPKVVQIDVFGLLNKS